MFQTLTNNLNKIFDRIKSKGALTESQIDDAMRDIRVALLEADVALSVVKDFISAVKQKAIGNEVVQSIAPGQMVVKIINDEMIKLLSSSEMESKLNLNVVPPASLLVVGFQGGGKTTASGKLALRLKKQNKKVLLVSLDTYRPAAQEQLEILAKGIDVDSLAIIKDQMPLDITARAMQTAKLGGYDVVIYDTAGRLHIDDVMINEVSNVKSMVHPVETLLVIDSMIGQDAINVAKVFDEKLSISGVILSRIDGDSRGGAALSIRHSTGKPIKFLSTGEKPADFEEFDAERITSRILDMGDVVSLVEKASEAINEKEAEKIAKRLQNGKFDLNDYMYQLRMIKKMGGFASMMSMIPGIGKLTGKLKDGSGGDKLLTQQEAIYYSMTFKERKNPDLLNASRKKRISSGSGVSVQQINTFIKQYLQISKVMKKVSRMDPKSLMRGGIGNLFS